MTAIDPDARELLDGIRRWIEIESPTDDPDAVGRMMDEAARCYASIGASLERVPGRDGLGDHLLATWRGAADPSRDAAPGILVLSHLDTVHPIGTLAHHLPFRIEGDRAYGPGAEDMKGGAYIAFAAVRDLLRNGLATHLPIRHLMTSDEEVGSPTSRELIAREARRARFVLVTEPARSGGQIVVARKGCVKFTLTVLGRAAHAGVEHHLGRSAIRELSRQILDLESMTDYARELTVNVGTVRGGTRPNVVSAEATAEIDIRVPSAALGEEIVARVRALQPYDPDCSLQIEGGIDRPGYEMSPAIASLFEHARQLAAEIGFELRGLKTGGGSDGNLTAAIAPTLDGLGVDGDGGHTHEERLYISSIVPRMQLLRRLYETLGAP